MTFSLKRDIMVTLSAMQASPSGMAAASQAASGEFDSRRLLHNREQALTFEQCIWNCSKVTPIFIRKIKDFFRIF